MQWKKGLDDFFTEKLVFLDLFFGFVVKSMSTASVLSSWSSTLNCCLECWAARPRTRVYILRHTKWPLQCTPFFFKYLDIQRDRICCTTEWTFTLFDLESSWRGDHQKDWKLLLQQRKWTSIVSLDIMWIGNSPTIWIFEKSKAD